MNDNTFDKNRRARVFDVIVKAVATGIFIGSLFLNLVFFLIILGMGLTFRATGDRGFQESGYRKVYLEDGSISPAGRVQKGLKREELLIIRLDGFISEFDTRQGIFEAQEDPVSAITNRLSIVKRDQNIRGILLMIESPGGVVTASDILYQRIKTFREETGIPVVTLMRQVAASGAYYVSAATDYIIAHPTTVTGSIGVIMYNFNFKGLMDRYGIRYISIKSSEHKDLMSPFKKIESDELQWLQGIVDQMLDKFIDAVAEGRKNLTRGEVEKLADGKIYIAKDALTRGLIDEIGYFEDAVRVLSEKAHVTFPSLVEYKETRGLGDVLGLVSLKKGFDYMSIEDFVKNQGGLRPNLDPYGIYYIWDGVLEMD